MRFTWVTKDGQSLRTYEYDAFGNRNLLNLILENGDIKNRCLYGALNRLEQAVNGKGEGKNRDEQEAMIRVALELIFRNYYEAIRISGLLLRFIGWKTGKIKECDKSE